VVAIDVLRDGVVVGGHEAVEHLVGFELARQPELRRVPGHLEPVFGGEPHPTICPYLTENTAFAVCPRVCPRPSAQFAN
jgi:hypothetical protein